MTICHWNPPAMSLRCLFPLVIAIGVAFASVPVMADGPSTKVEQVVVVFKTHFDIGYTDLARNVVNRYRTSMIDKALDVCEDAKTMPPEQRFVWTVPGWPMAQILWPGQTAERRQRTLQAIHDGRLVWHALPGSLHTESLDLEDLVRGMRFSSDLAAADGDAAPLGRQNDRRGLAHLDSGHHPEACGRGVSPHRQQFGERLARVAAVVLVGGARRLAAA